MMNRMKDWASLVQPVVRLKAGSLGDAGRRWLAGLPDLVSELETRWSVRVERSLGGGTSAFVGAARTAEGLPVVMKLSLPDPEVRDEIGTLARAHGRGYVRLLAHDTDRRAMLLEALGPSLSQADVSPERQIGILCRLLSTAWTVPPPTAGPSAVPHDKATALEALIRRLSGELAGPAPCSRQVLDRALRFARRRAEAFDPARSAQLHGDAAAANALQVLSPRSGAEVGFVFVDPDGFVGDPAYDLGVVLRDWCAELLASDDPRSLARSYAALLAGGTGLDEQAIWEWGYLERVSTGLYAFAMGAHALSRPFFETAESLL
jgi:streptomycin 6-kinase